VADAMVLLWSNKRGGWWRGNRHGYTTLIEQAGRFSRVDAERAVRNSSLHGQLTHREIDNLTGVEHAVPPTVIVPAPEVCRCGVSDLERLMATVADTEGSDDHDLAGILDPASDENLDRIIAMADAVGTVAREVLHRRHVCCTGCLGMGPCEDDLCSSSDDADSEDSGEETWQEN